MSALPAKPAQAAPSDTTAAPKPYVRPKRPRVDWKSVWPIPLAITATAGLAFGLFTAVARAPKEDPAIPLAQARAAYSSDKFTDAIEIINADLLPYINAGKLSPEQEKEFFQLRARSLYYGQERMGIAQEENFKAIIEAYEQGRRRDMTCEPADIGNIAESYMHLGETQKAIDLARLLEGRDDARQLRIYERIVDKQLKSGTTQYPLVLGLLNQMLQMPRLTIEQRAWVVARQAQMRLDAGFPQEAITRLLREMPKFETLPRDIRADLLYILGKAYADGVDEQQALIYLDQALRAFSNGKEDSSEALVLDTFDARAGEALVIQGRILAQNGKIEEARERFGLVRDNFKDSAVYPLAVLGEADTAAELADYESALKLYGEAADLVRGGSAKGVAGSAPVTLNTIGAKLMDQHNRRVLENDPVEALRFVRKAQEVYAAAQRLDGIPPEVYLAMGQASRLNAQIMLREAAGTAATDPAPRPEEVSPVAATQAKGYLLDAGQNFRDHAKAVVIKQFDLALQSWLAAGDCFDQAGEADSAIEAYATFLRDAREDYTDRPKAMFRLAQVYQGKGDFKDAAKLYEQLVQGREGTSGEWADKSLVPLARCYVSDPTLVETDADKGKDKKDVAAEKPNELRAIALLNRAVSGRAGVGPEAVQMRDAQAELGELYYRRGEFRQAIELFNRLIDTCHDQTPRLPTVLFKRADAHRQLAMQIAETFEQRPLSERQELAEAKRTHLRDARAGYIDAMAAVGKRGSRATRIEKLYNRNSAFYTADCAFLLGEYEQAVQEYARAREQYANDPAALVAMVQTVNAFVRLERWDDAQVASDRAKNLLSTIPEETWSNPELLLPMERKHWESWLAARIELERHGYKTANVQTPP